MNVIDGMMDTPSEANHTFVAIKSFSRWIAARGYAPDALAGLKKPVKAMSRSRVLSDPEMASVLTLARECGMYGVLLQLLLLTGQRLGQFAPTFTGTVKNDRIVWSAAAMKGNKEHMLPPLTDIVNSLLYQLKPFNN